MAVTGAAFAAFPYCLSPLIARAARENREPEDRLSDLPVAGRSVRFPEGASRRERGVGRSNRSGNSAAPACPLAGAIVRARQAGAAESRGAGIAPTPLAHRLRSREIGPIDLPLAGRSDGPLAPGFHGRRGRSEATGSKEMRQMPHPSRPARPPRHPQGDHRFQPWPAIAVKVQRLMHPQHRLAAQMGFHRTPAVKRRVEQR